MKLAIVTGVSRGLGNSTAKLLMEKGFHVLGVSRSEYFLKRDAAKHDVEFTHISCDLGKLTEVNQLCDQISHLLTKMKPKQCFLVNNAAVLEPIDQARNIASEDFAYHIQVNTVAPMILMNHCLREANEQNISFTGVTITSGAAKRPVFGWSAYCSTKASINMYTKTVALEQEQLQTGNHVIAFSPGVMDTEMQQKIRSSKEEQFQDVESFRKYKKENKLRDPEIVAEVLVNIMTGEVNNGNIYYVSDYI